MNTRGSIRGLLWIVVGCTAAWWTVETARADAGTFASALLDETAADLDDAIPGEIFSEEVDADEPDDLLEELLDLLAPGFSIDEEEIEKDSEPPLPAFVTAGHAHPMYQAPVGG